MKTLMITAFVFFSLKAFSEEPVRRVIGQQSGAAIKCKELADKAGVKQESRGNGEDQKPVTSSFTK